MSGTFSSFNTALGALHYNRALMDVASSNIANSTTEGYARRRVEGETVSSVGQPAMYARPKSPTTEEGVQATNVSRVTDEFINSRARFEHGQNSYLSLQSSVLSRFESSIGEPGDNGVSAALNDFRTGWHDLANSPDSAAARSQVLNRATTLAQSIQAQMRNVAQEESDQLVRLEALVSEVNTLAGDLAETNRSIAVAGFSGTDANLLLDQRDQLAMRLAELTGAVATRRGDNGFDVSVNGVSLVSGSTAGTFVLAAGATGGPVSFAVETGGAAVAVAAGLRGEVGATADLLNVTLPNYRDGLAAVVSGLVDGVNAQHERGYDLAGTQGGEFFAVDATGNLVVVITDPDQVAASLEPDGRYDGSNATTLAKTGEVEDAYRRLVNGLGSNVASVKRLSTNQQALTAQVDGTRDQLSGVSTDEELVNLVAAQRSYEAVSRVMTSLDEMLETLINRMGVVGR